MSKKISKLESLKLTANRLAQAFHFIASSSYPGDQSKNVAEVMTFLDDLHSQTTEKIKEIEAAQAMPS